jgi:hypothetical protein
MKKSIGIIVRTFLLISLLMVVESSSSVRFTKVENNNINKTVNLSTMALKVIEEEHSRLYTAIDSYTGDLTGYIYNCPLCNGTLACKSSYYIKDGTTTYPDKTYGTVRIVASSRNLPCGSIIRFNSSRISKDPVLAIVLDRGVVGSSIDLLSENETYAIQTVGRSSIYYEVLRSGW